MEGTLLLNENAQQTSARIKTPGSPKILFAGHKKQARLKKSTFLNYRLTLNIKWKKIVLEKT